MQENKILNTNDFKKKNWEHLIKREIPQTTNVLIYDRKIDSNSLDCEIELQEDGDKLYLSFYLNSDNEDWLKALKQRTQDLISSHKKAKNGDRSYDWVLNQNAITRIHYETEKQTKIIRQVIDKIVEDILKEERTYKKAFKNISNIENLYLAYKEKEAEMIKPPMI